MNHNNGQVVLITGASSGIGRELAILLAKEGARLALAARRTDRLTNLAAYIKAKCGQEPLVITADLRRLADIRAMAEKTFERFGRIDVLVNNAGVLYMEPFLTMPRETMNDIISTNFWAPLEAIRAVAPLMEKGGGGHIINISSGAGRRALPFMAAYASSKFALTGLIESVRVELSPKNIAFTTIYPGGVDTDMPGLVDRSKLPADYPDHSSLRVSAERAARAIAKAIRTRPLEVYVPWWIRLTAWLSVFSPGTADFLIKSRHRKDIR